MQKIFDWLTLDADTRELAKLNTIHKAFNNGDLLPAEVREMIYRNKWKHHTDKINVLVYLTFLKENLL